MSKEKYANLIQSLYSIPFIGGICGNAHRSEFLYLDTRTGVPLLYLWDGNSHVLTPGDEPVAGPAALHNTNPWVVFSKDVGGSEDYTLYFVDYTTKKTTQITETPIGRLAGLFWASDDIIVVGCDKKEYYIRLYSLDGSSTSLYTTDQQILSSDYDYHRNVVVAAVGRGPGSKIGIFHKEITWISESDQSEDTFPCVYPEKGYIAYGTDVSGNTEIVVRSIETLKEIMRAPVEGDIEFLPGHGNIVWVDENTLFAAAAKDAQISPRLLTISDKKWSPPLADISVLMSKRTSLGPVWVGSSFSQPACIQMLKEKKVVTIIQPEYTGEYPSGESHWYPSFDGRKIQGWLIKNNNPHASLVVFCHGGPNYATLNMWRPDVQQLVQAGYHVFAPNFRGSTTFGSEFKKLNIGDVGGGDSQDVLYGAQYAAKILGIKEKPAITGGSYGGYLTLRALTMQPDAWAGGVAIVPWVEMVETYNLADAHYRALSVYLFSGTPDENPELYKDRSPMAHLEKVKSPVLLIAGENDSRCPLHPIQKFYEKAKKLNLPVELEVIKGEGHGSLRISDIIKMSVLQLEYLETLF
jgi:dipeptidyl aminopeptidase/acylaminoacyl peptidase